MITDINSESTAALLRNLAIRIESGEDIPDFMLAIVDNDWRKTAHNFGIDPYALVGAIDLRKAIILSEMKP